MSVGDPICPICGVLEPCGCNKIITCAICEHKNIYTKKPAVCPKCNTDWTYGWKEPVYKNRPTTVDVIAIDTSHKFIRKILLIKRVNDPFKDHWAIPGGFINYDEELETAAAREFSEETGLVSPSTSMSLLGVYSKIDRDERHCISHVYYTHSWAGKLNAGDDAKETKWFEIYEAEKMKLAFDHSTIIRDLIIEKEW